MHLDMGQLVETLVFDTYLIQLFDNNAQFQPHLDNADSCVITQKQRPILLELI